LKEVKISFEDEQVLFGKKDLIKYYYECENRKTNVDKL